MARSGLSCGQDEILVALLVHEFGGHPRPLTLLMLRTCAMGVLNYNANSITLQRMPPGQELPSELYTFACAAAGQMPVLRGEDF